MDGSSSRNWVEIATLLKLVPCLQDLDDDGVIPNPHDVNPGN